MKKILFPTDLSPASDNAFLYALQLAKHLHAEIVTLHVAPYLMSVGQHPATVQENYEIQELTEFESYKSEVPRFRDMAEKNHCGHVKLSHVLENGDTVENILEVVNRDEIDIVVMATDGAHGMTEALYGSVTEKIMNRANAMVLAVPASCSYSPISKILFLTQFEDRHKQALRKLMDLTGRFKAHIEVLHICKEGFEIDDEIIAKWKREFLSSNITFNVLTNDSPEKAIMEFVRLNQISIVAMTVKHKGLFQKLFMYSMASKMAFHSEIPVLSLRYE